MKRMKRNFIIKQMTKRKPKNSKIVFTSQKKIKNPGPTLQSPRCFLEAKSSKESERGRFGAGDKRADRRGCELSGGSGTRPGSTGNAGRRLDGRRRIRHS